VSYGSGGRSLANQLFVSVGQLLAVLLALVIALFAYLWAVTGSVEYHMRPVGQSPISKQLEQVEALNERVGCELWGRPVKDSGGWYARFRFPAQIEDELTPCLASASKGEFSIEKASWFQAKVHQLTR
jgi:hypothetical protein